MKARKTEEKELTEEIRMNFSGRRGMSTRSDAMKSQASKMNFEQFEQKKIFGKENRF